MKGGTKARHVKSCTALPSWYVDGLQVYHKVLIPSFSAQDGQSPSLIFSALSSLIRTLISPKFAPFTQYN